MVCGTVCVMARVVRPSVCSIASASQSISAAVGRAEYTDPLFLCYLATQQRDNCVFLLKMFILLC